MILKFSTDFRTNSKKIIEFQNSAKMKSISKNKIEFRKSDGLKTISKFIQEFQIFGGSETNSKIKFEFQISRVLKSISKIKKKFGLAERKSSHLKKKFRVCPAAPGFERTFKNLKRIFCRSWIYVNLKNISEPHQKTLFNECIEGVIYAKRITAEN